jgi:hypothetical protein
MLKQLARMLIMRKHYAFLDVVTGLSVTDYRGTEWTGCICGCDWILTPLAFTEEGEVNSYGTDGFCAGCGALISVPCPTAQQ